MIEFDNLTYLHGKPQGTGLLKANPEDFVVVEDLGFEPDGEGEHILVRILKNGCNTRFVADALAKFLKIHSREVSFAGQKDKHAVTEQWLCARVPGKEMPDLSAVVRFSPRRCAAPLGPATTLLVSFSTRTIN